MSCASSESSVRPALRRTRERGIITRAAATMRTSSIPETGGRSASGVPGTRTRALMGTLSGCGSSAASSTSIAARSSIDSPIPMMPPLHTVMPASRTRRSVRSLSS